MERTPEKGLFFSSGSEESRPRLFSGSFRKIKGEILNLFMQEEYEKLRVMLSSVSPKNKEVFFEKHGDSILYHAVANSNDTEALKIIMENIPTTMLQKLLRDNDF